MTLNIDLLPTVTLAPLPPDWRWVVGLFAGTLTAIVCFCR